MAQGSDVLQTTHAEITVGVTAPGVTAVFMCTRDGLTVQITLAGTTVGVTVPVVTAAVTYMQGGLTVTTGSQLIAT